MKILKYAYTIPYFGNSHLMPYGKIIFINDKGKTISLYYELEMPKRGYIVRQNYEMGGSLYSPVLTVERVKHGEE